MNLIRGRRDAARFAAFPDAEKPYAYFMLDLCGGVLERRPAHVASLAAAAELLTALGHYEAGLALDRRLARLRAEDAGVWYNLACSLSLTGAYPRAAAALRRAVRLGYEDATHMNGDDDLAGLRRYPRYQEAFRALMAAAAANRRRREGTE